jgi:8-oxo-dGTP diphosphatase
LFTYKHPRPAVSVDIAIFMPLEGKLHVLLIQRAQDPYRGLYALPGGFVEIEETLEDAATRELKEETGLEIPQVIQIHTFSALDRDPRGRVISTCFGAILPDSSHLDPRAGSDAADFTWCSLEDLPTLAFDHALVIQTALEKLLYPGRSL